eukprot:CAMPEP_0177155916 /NCGR_PEP_ID=MMETSP0367-20130122/2434_1 /TAXON_ID=447022 ORGANISM="Scrippsiella hangoei-like, Strain SHHI-4" /NCGR_SAMPLE_ID=MMETSP0367 /ASSEMBLY_ACC=CAM_ASM_000362 /LENGTH=71 /DNA_ID=CAMNT_0018601307 /DNA_START=206 /DNA_END=418 /DNA_ORIENTATION=-
MDKKPTQSSYKDLRRLARLVLCELSHHYLAIVGVRERKAESLASAKVFGRHLRQSRRGAVGSQGPPKGAQA